MPSLHLDREGVYQRFGFLVEVEYEGYRVTEYLEPDFIRCDVLRKGYDALGGKTLPTRED